MSKQNHQPLSLEITVISAEGLKNESCSFFTQRLRPFITLTTTPPTNSHTLIYGDGRHPIYQTRVDQEGGDNPSWGDKFHLPIETTFFSQRYSSIYLQIFTKRLMGSKAQLGWCQIPATDIIEGFRPAGSVRHLSYRVRTRDGTRGHGVVHVAVILVGTGNSSISNCSDTPAAAGVSYSPVTVGSQTAIGIPVNSIPHRFNERFGGDCAEDAQKSASGRQKRGQ